MRVTIKATNLDLTPAIKKEILEKIATLDEFIPRIDTSVEAFVEVALTTYHHRKGKIYYAEVNIKVPGKIIRSEAKEENLSQAITVVKDELQRTLKKYKRKRVAKGKRGVRALKRKWRYSFLTRKKEKGRRIRHE